MSSVYFISDTHIGHNGARKFRPQFSSQEERDYVILDNINSSVNKRDVLWMLGDIAFTKEALTAVKEINCTEYLVLGNHDVNERGIHITDLVGVYSKVVSLTKYTGVLLSHCPINKQQFRTAKFNIHGHIHNETIKDEHGNNDKSCINVCVEQINYKPINWLELKEGIINCV